MHLVFEKYKLYWNFLFTLFLKKQPLYKSVKPTTYKNAQQTPVQM